jgi:hypothetical protein
MEGKQQGIEPTAIAVGLGVAALLFIVHKRRSARCTTFPHTYSKSGPIFLQADVKEEAMKLADLKVEEARIAGAIISKYDIQLYLAEHFSEGCNWEEGMDTDEGKAVWDSYGKIAQWAIDKAPESEQEE